MPIIPPMSMSQMYLQLTTGLDPSLHGGTTTCAQGSASAGMAVFWGYGRNRRDNIESIDHAMASSSPAPVTWNLLVGFEPTICWA
jgi:hypothetical protein